MSIEHNEQQTAAAQEPIGYRWRHSASEAWQYSNFPCGWEHQPLYAAPVTAAPATYFPLTLRGLIAYGQVAADPSQRAVPNHMRYLIEQMVPHLKRLDEIESNTPAAPGIDLAALRARVVSAIERITSGTGQMRVPADLTDPDLVLADVLTLLDALDPHCTDSPKGGSEARDAARLDWLDTHSFTAYRQYDPIIGLAGHCVVVHETVTPRRGNVHDTIRGAIDAAMRARAGDAEVQP